MIDYNKLKTFRENNSLTTAEVAKKIKRSKKVIEDWESGNKEIEESDLIKLAKLYKVEVSDFNYVDEKIKTNYVVVGILLVIGIISCLLLKNLYLLIILPISFVNVYLLYSILKKNNKITLVETEPKSVLNFKLEEPKKKRVGIYILECNIISSAYLIFNTICELIGFRLFIFKLDIISNANVNKLVLNVGVYLLLFILSFIIELVFGENMINKKNKKESE